MPKRTGYIYKKMCDKDLIRVAIKDGSKGKRKRWDVKIVMADQEGYTEKVYDLLIRHAYRPTVPKKKTIYDKSSGKQRDIKIVPFFPDGIIHQLMVMAAKDVFMRGMYRWSCASIPGRGNKCAADYTKKALANDLSGTKYCLKMDIYHYYPSIPRDRLLMALERKVKDRDYLDLAKSVVDSDPDDGLAIGFYTNQWLANFYLETLDRYILTLPGVNHYVRNMDDMVILGSNKRHLHKARKKISEFLYTNLGLQLKGNWQVFPVDARGIDFVGYRFFHTHTILRKRNFLRFTRSCRRVKKRMRESKAIPYQQAAGLLARKGQLKHCDSTRIRERYYDQIGDKLLKDIIRNHSRKKAVNDGSDSTGADQDLQRYPAAAGKVLRPAGAA